MRVPTVESTVIVTVSGNDGRRFTQHDIAGRSNDWESLTLADSDLRVDDFDDKLRKRFDEAIATAIGIERRYSSTVRRQAN